MACKATRDDSFLEVRCLDTLAPRFMDPQTAAQLHGEMDDALGRAVDLLPLQEHVEAVQSLRKKIWASLAALSSLQSRRHKPHAKARSSRSEPLRQRVKDLSKRLKKLAAAVEKDCNTGEEQPYGTRPQAVDRVYQQLMAAAMDLGRPSLVLEIFASYLGVLQLTVPRTLERAFYLEEVADASRIRPAPAIYTIAMRAKMQKGRPEEALALFEQMREASFCSVPDIRTFNAALDAIYALERRAAQAPRKSRLRKKRTFYIEDGVSLFLEARSLGMGLGGYFPLPAKGSGELQLPPEELSGMKPRSVRRVRAWLERAARKNGHETLAATRANPFVAFYQSKTARKVNTHGLSPGAAVAAVRWWLHGPALAVSADAENLPGGAEGLGFSRLQIVTGHGKSRGSKVRLRSEETHSDFPRRVKDALLEALEDEGVPLMANTNKGLISVDARHFTRMVEERVNAYGGF